MQLYIILRVYRPRVLGINYSDLRASERAKNVFFFPANILSSLFIVPIFKTKGRMNLFDEHLFGINEVSK